MMNCKFIFDVLTAFCTKVDDFCRSVVGTVCGCVNTPVLRCHSSRTITVYATFPTGFTHTHTHGYHHQKPPGRACARCTRRPARNDLAYMIMRLHLEPFQFSTGNSTQTHRQLSCRNLSDVFDMKIAIVSPENRTRKTSMMHGANWLHR